MPEVRSDKPRVCFAVKHFGFAISVLILNEDASKVVRLLRKEACYCRFAPADNARRIVYPIDPKQKTAFKFLSDRIPDVRALYYIRGKRYICENLTATFTEQGMSQLIKGCFYPVED